MKAYTENIKNTQGCECTGKEDSLCVYSKLRGSTRESPSVNIGNHAKN